MKPTITERFWAKVDKNGPNGCWVWTGSKTISQVTENSGLIGGIPSRLIGSPSPLHTGRSLMVSR